jgi:hypothetical protein
MKDPHTGRSRGFGFVTFTDASVPDTVVAAGTHMIDGRNVCGDYLASFRDKRFQRCISPVIGFKDADVNKASRAKPNV